MNKNIYKKDLIAWKIINSSYNKKHNSMQNWTQNIYFLLPVSS